MDYPILKKNGLIKVIQISDTHLFSDDNSTLYGIRTNITFNEVINKILHEDIHDTDMIFLTGDMSQDETEQSYEKIANSLEIIEMPIYWIPGNHDNLHKIESVFKKTRNLIRRRFLSFLNWNFIFLNTKLDDSDKGYLAQSEMDILQDSILKYNDKKLVIVMHHHPVEVNTPLIDNYILQNRDDLWRIIGTKIELIICGHVHGDYTIIHNTTRIETAPATCLQWEKGTKDLMLEKKIGYKIFYFTNDSYYSTSKIW